MFADLSNFIDTNFQQKSNYYIMVTEANVNASFILHHFISLYLENKSAVCLVGLTQSFPHFSNICCKLSLDFKKFNNTGKLEFVNGLVILEKYYKNYDKFENKRNFLKDLYNNIKTQWNNLDNNQSKILIIDDISLLVSLGCSAMDVSIFNQYLKNLIRKSDKSNILTLIKYNPLDEEIERLKNDLSYHANIILSVKSLETGYCRDISGEIGAMFRNPYQTVPQIDKLKLSHFKISDKNISLFPLGLSTVVV